MRKTRQLRDALSRWRDGDRDPLLVALGFERVGFRVPHASIADFGLDANSSLTLELAARHAGFDVFRITFADGLEPEEIRRTAGALYRHNPTRRALLIFEAEQDGRLVFASWGLGPGPFRLLKLWIDPETPRRSELDILAGLAANGAGTASELALAHAQALDREEVTRKFFAEFRRHRAQLAASLIGVPTGAERDRLDLALTLLSRLLFLYFIQRKGWLAGDPAYLRNLYEAACVDGIPFYRRRLKPLFFGALNRHPKQRSRRALELGELPFLNGGLFERDALERKHKRLDVRDECFAPIFDELLDKYQFTLRDDQTVDQDVAVDPEMLGKVFEGLLAGPVRGSTGAYFTPRSLVDRLVNGALSSYLYSAVAQESHAPRELVDQLLAGKSPDMDVATRDRLAARVKEMRVLDPAVGSGAFLLAALHRLEALRDALEGRPADSFARFERRHEILRRNLHGVDVNGAAVRLCELRLWLALVVDLEVDSIADVPPLPNLDINIRQGDALLDPIDFLVQVAGLDDRNLAGRWRTALTKLAKRKQRYFRASGDAKRRVGRTLRKSERELAQNFMAELAGQIDERRNDLRTAANSRDLFGERVGLTAGQKRVAEQLDGRRQEVRHLLNRIGELEELPFFSFPIHFADPDHLESRFHVVLANPPWVRTHHWSGLPRVRLKQRYQFLRDAGWKAGARMAGVGRGFGAQLDLSALFLERSLELLSDDGALAFLLPAKLVRALSSGAVRRHLIERTRIVSLEDCSATPARLFEATTYPLALTLTQGAAPPEHEVQIRLHDRVGAVHEFQSKQSRLPLLADDAESPWVLAPPRFRAALDRMRAAGPPLGAYSGRRPRRGVFTGANDVFVGETIDLPAADGCKVISVAGSEVEIEIDRLRPALRGEDLSPWQFRLQVALIWTHEDSGLVMAKLPMRTARHLSAHRRLLKTRRDLKPGQLPWTLFRVAPEKWSRRVAWRDIGTEPGAVVIPARAAFLGSAVPIISLNTVYQIPTRSERDAHFLAAILNSTPARAYLKAIAQRASGGHFRFFSSTVALLPLPTKPEAMIRDECIELSRAAHAEGKLAPARRKSLDRLVARLFGLRAPDIAALRSFDANFSNPKGDET